VSVPLVGPVAPWQATFFIVGLPGLAIAVIFLFMREPRRIGRTATDGAASAGFDVMFQHVGRRWKIYGSFVIFVCIMTISAYSQGWFAAMFARTWGWEARTYALVNGIILLAVGPLTVNIAGYLSDKRVSEGITRIESVSGFKKGKRYFSS